MLNKIILNLSKRVTVVHTSRLCSFTEYKMFKYVFKDVLAEINERSLHLAYQRWKTLPVGTDFSKQIAPIREVNRIMERNEWALVCDDVFVQELNRAAKTLFKEPVELFILVLQQVVPDFHCTSTVMYGMLAMMLNNGIRIK